MKIKFMMIRKRTRKLLNKYSFIRKKYILIVLAAIIFLSALSAVYTYYKNAYISYFTVTLNYSEGRVGLNPEGGRFNIADIKSDEVIRGAIDIMGDDTLTVEDLKQRISIDTVVPKSSVDNAISAISDNTYYSYSPSEFDIYYSQKDKFAKNETEAFLKALSESYTNYFNENYAHKNNVLAFDIGEDLKDCDYNEKYQRIYDKLSAMQRFLDKRASENNTFKSKEMGYTYSNIGSLLNNVKNGDLEKLNAYIKQNKITNDKSEFIRKNEFARDKVLLKYNINADGSKIAQEAMGIYNPYITSVAFIPTVDENDEFYMSRTKTGLDTLVKDSYSQGSAAINFKKTIDEYDYLLERYKDAKETDDEVKGKADEMVENICGYLSKISDIAIKTDNEYLKENNKNYMTFYFHPKSKTAYVKKFIVNMILFSVIACILAAVYVKFRDRVAKLFMLLNGDNDNEA
ncbi:MAG: hypothetical protein PUF72_03220 [Clostridiales bacterium]|nr:hypothetical protein [Clostridiales bacterium]